MDVDVTELKGQFVQLEPLHQSHVEVLRTLARDERIWEFTKTLLISETFSDQFNTYIATALDSNGTGQQRSFVVRDVQSGDIIGMTRYYRIEPANKRLTIGYTWYTPTCWGLVHNKECKLLLLQYAFEYLSFQRVEFEVAGQNVRSQRAVEKIGGVKEAVLRKHGIRPDGSIRDTVIFSIIDDEWPATKKRLLTMIEHHPAEK